MRPTTTPQLREKVWRVEVGFSLTGRTSGCYPSLVKIKCQLENLNRLCVNVFRRSWSGRGGSAQGRYRLDEPFESTCAGTGSPNETGGLRGTAHRKRTSAMTRWNVVVTGVAFAAVTGAIAQTLAPPAFAVPAPEVEYVYNVVVRRHYAFPNNDALGYGFGICDRVRGGESYAEVVADVRTDVLPSDEQSANYLVSYAVGILCPAEIWQLRNSAASHQPSTG